MELGGCPSIPDAAGIREGIVRLATPDELRTLLSDHPRTSFLYFKRWDTSLTHDNRTYAPRSWTMRLFSTLFLIIVHFCVQAQGPGIATLLSLADCLDATCVTERLRPMGFCLKGGHENDAWRWYSCGPLDPLVDHERSVTLAFLGHANSNYRDYLLITGDTSLADALTAELHQLGFTLERPLRSNDHIYGNAAYPTLEIHRREIRSATIHYMRSGDPADPRALPTDKLGCDHENLQKEAQEEGYDSIEVIPELRWAFSVRVPTPHLGILPGEKDGTIKLYYLVDDAVAEFTIRDLSGKVVRRSMTQDWLTELDLSDLSHGVYYITIFSKWGTISKAFMKI